jgi:hypothetical protein
MKNKFRIILVIALCFILPAMLFACRPDDNGGGEINNANNNINNINNINAPGENISAVAANTSFTSKELADAVMAAFTPEELPDSGLEHFFSGAPENSENHLEPDRASILINRNLQPVEEFEYVEDFAFYMPAGQSIIEVSILKVKPDEINNIGAAGTILQRRLDRIDRGQLITYAAHEVPVLDNAKIITVYNYIIFLATFDNRKAENIISGMIYGDTNISLDAGESVPDVLPESDQVTNNAPVAVNMDNVAEIESEILFDFDILASIDMPTSGGAAANRTALPRVDIRKHSHNTHFLIGGRCESGAMIRVTGGLHEIYTGSNHGNFLVEIPFDPEGTTILRLTAEAPGKEPSEEIAFVVKARRDVRYYDDFGTFGVIVGYNHMTYFHDCIDHGVASALLASPDTEIAALATRTAAKITQLRDRGSNAEIIYLLAPNTARIWAEDLPSRHADEPERLNTILRNFTQGVTQGGGTVIDLTDVMLANKNNEYKIWHFTDSHWTEFGAYLAYVELMDHIAQRFPDAAPRPQSDFEFYNIEIGFGDVAGRLGFNHGDLREYTTFANFRFNPPAFNDRFPNQGHLGMELYTRGNSYIIHNNVNFEHTTRSNLTGLELPSIYMMRDSFEGPLHAFYTDRFSSAHFVGMWNYHFDLNAIVRANPDYVIYMIGERNIKNVLYQ